jgi:Arc/MetJ family transcription regulator
MGRDGTDDKEKAADLLVRRLVKETGVTEKQARDLIQMIGSDWASLVREARCLKGRH